MKSSTFSCDYCGDDIGGETSTWRRVSYLIDDGDVVLTTSTPLRPERLDFHPACLERLLRNTHEEIA